MFFLCRLMERKSFFYANYFNWSLTSPVVLDTRAAVEPSLWRNLTESWSTSIVLTVFPWILEVNASKEEKRACPFSSLTPRRKKTTKSFCKVWVSKLAESDKGSYYNQEKWLKDDKASGKTHWNYREIEFHKFLSEWSELFRSRSGQASDKFATGPAPYKKKEEGLFWKSIVAGEQLQEKLQ